MKIIIISLLFVLFACSLQAQSKKVHVSNSNYVSILNIDNGDGIIETKYEIKLNIENGFYKVYYDSSYKLLAITGEIRNKKRNGNWIYYYKNGNKKRSTFFYDNIKNGKEKFFNSNNILIEEKNYKNGLLDGEFIQYNSIGSIRTSVWYSKGEINLENNDK